MMASQTIKEKFFELQKSKQTPQNSRPKIQRVAYYRRKISNFEKHYTPKLVSIGPIHHDNEDLKLGEKYKLMWASKYIEKTRCNPEELHKKIADNIDELKGRFSEDVLTLTGNSLEGYGSLEEKLSWILFVDGCSFLHILEKGDPLYPEHMNMKVDQMSLLMMDVLLLENQLPYEVLKLLWKDDDESELIESMKKFLSGSYWGAPYESRSEKEKDEISNRKGEGEHIVSLQETPTHLLDLHRKNILTPSNSKGPGNATGWKQLLQKIKKWIGKNTKGDFELMTYRNIQDLKAAGIRLKSSMTQNPSDIVFSEGWFAATLTLPMINVNDSLAPTFLNLVAYEMCPDFYNNYEICSFVVFMDSLIDHPQDVKELRSKGILHNCLGSDEEVSTLFNMISTDLVQNGSLYVDVRQKIHDHYRNRCNTWIAQGFHTYFSSPWAIIAFIAAVIALVLTFIQTVFTVNPPS